MRGELRIDVADQPELLRLAQQVSATQTANVLSQADEPLASVRPLRRRRTSAPPSAADFAATHAAAGSWKGLVDGEQLKRRIYRARGSGGAMLSGRA
jgi:hypothetical protein